MNTQFEKQNIHFESLQFDLLIVMNRFEKSGQIAKNTQLSREFCLDKTICMHYCYCTEFICFTTLMSFVVSHVRLVATSNQTACSIS